MIILRIIYHFGDNYFGHGSSILNTYLPPIISGLISFIIAYFIFWKSRENEKKKEDDNRKAHINRFGKLFIELLNSCIESSKKQSEKYNQFAAKLSNDLLGQHFPTFYTHENLDRLQKMDIEKIMDFYETTTASNNDYITTLLKLDYLKQKFAMIQDDVLIKKQKQVVKWTNSLKRVSDDIYIICVECMCNIRLKNPEKYKEDILWKFLNNLVTTYNKIANEQDSIKRQNEELFIPILNTLHKEEYQKVYIDTCIKLINKAKEGGDLVLSIKTMNTKLCQTICKSVNQINISIKSLEDIKGKLIDNKTR